MGFRKAMMELGTGLPSGPAQSAPDTSGGSTHDITKMSGDPLPSITKNAKGPSSVAKMPKAPSIGKMQHAPGDMASHFAKAHNAFVAGDHAAAKSHAFKGIRNLKPSMPGGTAPE